MSVSAADSIETVDQFITHLGATKVAEANTEAGGRDGATTHPVKDVDDRTEDAQEGARSSENSQDVKDPDIGPGQPSVDATSEATSKVGMEGHAGKSCDEAHPGQSHEDYAKKHAAAEGTAAEDQTQIGTNKQPTGDDPSNETSGTKAKKEDGQYDGSSSHPARTDNDELDGHKYAGADVETASLEKLAEEMKDLGDQICADLTTHAHSSKQADQTTNAASDAPAEGEEEKDAMKGKKGMKDKDGMGGKYASAIERDLGRQIGWEMAGLVTGNFDKRAADSLVRSTLNDIVKTAEGDADNVAAFLGSFESQKQETKQAEGGMAPEEPGAPAEPRALADEGGDAAAEALGGAAMPEAGGGGGAGGEDPGLELAAVLDQLGITPEELLMALQSEGGAGAPPGAAPGAAPEAPPAAGPEAALGGGPAAGGLPPMGAAASDKQAADPTSDEKKAALADYVKEVVGRARAKFAAAKAKKEAEATA